MLLLFLIWVAAELAAIVLVAEWIGVFWMLVLLVASFAIGLQIIRWQARTAGQRVTARAGSGETATPEVVEGALGILAGALFVIPGFLADIVGAVLLIGPIRRPVGRLVQRSRRMQWVGRGAGWVGTASTGFGARFGGGSEGRGRQRYDAESTAHDINERQIDQRDPEQDL